MLLKNYGPCLRGQCPGANILLFAFSACKNWCCYIGSYYSLKISKKISRTIDITSTQTNFIAQYLYGRKIFHTHILKRNMLISNALLLDNFIKRYYTSDFVKKLMTARKLCKQGPIQFHQLLRECTNTLSATKITIFKDRKIAGSSLIFCPEL